MNIGGFIPDASRLSWYKSSYSGDEGGECSEVAVAPCHVHVRDSKNRCGSRRATGTDFTESATGH